MRSILSDEQLSKLKFIQNQIYVCPKKLQVFLGHVVNKDSYSRIESLLRGRDSMEGINKGKKAYILPEITTSVNTYKEFLRKNGYLIASSPKNADFIVGSSDLLTAKVDQFHLLDTSDEHIEINKEDVDVAKLVGDYTGITSPSGMFLFNYEDISANANALYFVTESKYLHIVSDNMMEVVYRILAKKLPVVNCDFLFDNFEKLVINDEMYKSIEQMLKGSRGDKTIAFELLCQCDFIKSSFYLRKLKEYKYYSTTILGKTKLAKKLEEHVYDLANMNNEAILKYLFTNNVLTESFYTECIIDETLNYDYLNDDTTLVGFKVFPKMTYEEYVNSQSNNENND